MPKLSIRDIDLANKHVFIRVDFNVPLTEDGATITDDTRIVATLPTIEYALRHKAKVILASHLGRPKGKPNPKYSLRPVVDRLRELLDKQLDESINVAFSPDCVGEIANELARQLESGQVLLLENLRFHAEEEANDPAFSKALRLARRGLRQRRFRLRAPRPCVHRGHYALPQARRRRPADGKGNHLPRQSPRSRPKSPSSPSSAAPKSPARSTSSTTCSTRWTRWSSSAAWPTPSSAHSASPPANRSLKKTRSTWPRQRSKRRRPRASISCSRRQHSRRQLCSRRQDPAMGHFEELPRRLAGPRHRAQVRRGHRRGCVHRPHDRVERPRRRLRVSALCRRHQRHRESRCSQQAAISIIGGGDSASAPSTRPELPTRSPTSPPAAAPASSSSKAKNCPASKR